LEKALKVFLPKFDEKARQSLQTTVVDPAATLAQELQLSIDKFEVMPTGLTPSSSRGDLSMYECQNLLPPKRILKFPSANSRNNRYIMDIYPGLFYQAVKGNSYDAVQGLTKPKILVASTKPEEGVYKPPHVQSGKYVTWVGWLEDIGSGKKHNNKWLTF
jgi:hypothetical protein